MCLLLRLDRNRSECGDLYGVLFIVCIGCVLSQVDNSVDYFSVHVSVSSGEEKSTSFVFMKGLHGTGEIRSPQRVLASHLVN